MQRRSLSSKKYFIYLLFLCLSTTLFSQRDTYQFAVIKQLELLAYNTVSSFYQSESGVMWINSNAGLIRFNGSRAEVIAYSIGMKPIVGSNDYVYCSMTDGLMRINVKTNEKEIILQDKVRWDNSHISIYNNILFVAHSNVVEIYHDTLFQKSILLPSNEIICHIYSSGQGKVWLGTQKGTLYRFSMNSNLEKVGEFPGEISALFIDSRDYLWVGTISYGAYCVDVNGTTQKRYSTSENIGQKISNNFIRSFCEDSNGQIWMATMDGVNVLNFTQTQIVSFSIGSTEEKSVWALYPDRQGNIWVGTYFSGVYLFNSSTAAFYLYTTNEDVTMVNRMLEDKRGDLWIFTDGSGVFRQKSKGDVQLVLSSIKKTKSAYYDRDKDVIWIGTYLEGLYCYSITQDKLTKILFNDEQMNKNIVAINDIVYHEETLYIGTTNGMFAIDMENTNQAYPVSTYQSLVHSLMIDKDNYLWITGIGVYKYCFSNKTTEKISNKIVLNFPDDVQFKEIYQDDIGRIWISVLRYGLLMIDNDQSTLFNDENAGLGDKFISTISQTKEGVILLGTNSGFSLFFPEKKRCIAYNSSKGFPLRSTRNGCILHLVSGEILIGGTTGIAMLSNNLTNVEQPISIYFDRLRINNHNVDVLDQISEDKLSLTYTKGISLNHLQKNIAIEVASTGFSHTQHTFHEYRLEGYETEWTRFSLSSPIIYMNLPPGKYVLKVRAYSDLNMSDIKEIKLPIRALPPWYDTLLAKFGYFILFILFVFGVFYFFYSRILFHEKLKQQEANAQARLRFFTNVSHEIRTPLTLIIGHLAMLVNNSKPQSNNLHSAFENAKKMQELVTELLEFEKQVLGYKLLSVSYKNFSEFINNIYNSFQSYAIYREINFKLHLEEVNMFYYYDYNQLQKVFFNLLMNAFKHTPKGGNVIIEVNLENIDIPINKSEIAFIAPWLTSFVFKARKKTCVNMLTIRVSDTGQGISSKKIDLIFDPFYQDSTNFSYDKYNKGTGIGLSIAKNIIEQHQGFIWAESKVGEGTVFTVALPTDKLWFNDGTRGNEVIQSDSESLHNALNVESNDDIDNTLSQDFETVKDSIKTEKKKILIVEDDLELQNLLFSLFSPVFKVLKSTNGLDAFTLAEKQQPDIIVSDVMMPVMDGLELCSKIKGTLATSHIPVILLTARSTEDQNIEGICAGADDYIIKPFSIEILIAKCNSLLRNREVLIHKYRHSISISADTIVSTTHDMLFLEKLVSVIGEHLNDEKLGVPLLCSEMAMSKTLLSNKIKKITKESPAEFIQTLKMKRAAWMILNEPHKSVSDIAYELGFSSLGYFGIRFKKHFGKSPTDLKNDGGDINTV
ncbi:MAG: two-component regulator propeller domain-containing protein [Paludibacter sp.]|nr:two-component regulator propeller domain-containing protein [Paludibacter sp.]